MKITIYPSVLVCVILLILSDYSKLTAGPPWVKYTLGYNYIMMGIDFPSNQDNIGFMVGESVTYNGNGIILKTTDGGNTWVQMWTGVNMGLEGASFVDVNNGFVAGWPKISNGWSGFGKTTDGGVTWTSPPVTPDPFYFTDVVFKDANNGILLGSTNSSPVVYVTSNGGSSWISASGVSANMPMSGCYVSGSTYYLVDNGGHIKKSIDNGLNWTTVFTVPGGLFTGIDFLNNTIGMACGDNGLIVKTSDGGATWAIQVVGTDIWRDFGWENPEHVFCSGTPEIVAESTNGGVTWENGFPQSTYQAALYECIFTPDGHGFICGSQGTLLKRLPSCTAAFSSGAPTICTGGHISFSDQSYGNISTYDWYFEGGNPSASNQPDPVVTYSNPGIFDVRLVVNNGFWSDTLLKSDYVSVNYTAAPVIEANSFTLTSNTTGGNQWYRDGTFIPGANGQSYQVSQSGWYWDVVTQNGCSSDTSNNIYILMTSVEDRLIEEFSIIQDINGGSKVLKIQDDQNGSYTCLIFSCEGKKILERELVPTSAGINTSISLDQLPTGIYLIQIRGKSTVFNRKVFILH